MSDHGVLRRALVLCTAVMLACTLLPVPAGAADVVVWQAQGGAAWDGVPGARFGQRVAVWGDTAVAGAPQDSMETGAVYVYQRLGPMWMPTEKLTADDGVPGDRFGASIAVCGDTVIVGADLANTSAGEDAGAAYIFVHADSAWSQQAKLTAPVAEPYTYFGWDVAVDGDTVIVGELWGDAAGVDKAGAAHVYTRSGGLWTHRRTLVSPVPRTYERFGCSVDLHRGTAVIGADSANTPTIDNTGAAYVYTGSGASWTYRQKLVASDAAWGMFFGDPVKVDRDTIVAGARYTDGQRGAAYVFRRAASGTWSQEAKLVATDRAAGDYFGESASVSGDVVIVGAYGCDTTGGVNAGAAYVFRRSGTAWPQLSKLTASTGAANDQFGSAVAVRGGVVLVGAPADDNERGVDAGMVYAYAARTELSVGVTRVSGTNRYLTALAASKRGFPVGASAVVVATGENWPDALGGSALAGAAHGPLLLTRKDHLPAEVAAEVKRLGAVKAYVLGSTASVSAAAEDVLVTLLGRANVVRLGGSDRYATARLVADETIRLYDFTYIQLAFVATGSNYPDATAAAPFAAWRGIPIVLANVRTGAVSLPPEVRTVFVLGSNAAVPDSIYESLERRLGDPARITRLEGPNRYATAVKVAQRAVSFGMEWNGVGLATGENFPDALAAGPMLATNGSVLLLTRQANLPGETYSALHAERASIASMFIFGDINAVSSSVETAAKAAAGL